MAGIVAEACTRLQDLIKERKAEIILPETWPVAVGQQTWVEEVWVNYISNAVKYGGQPPRVELGWNEGGRACSEQSEGIKAEGRNSSPILHPLAFTFWVRDNGPGLTPEEQARLFIPFTRLDKMHIKGHGLGLSIVRRIVEKLGGQVGVESEGGAGSTFWFTLPGPTA
jgi:signal transduction histidine kinase